MDDITHFLEMDNSEDNLRIPQPKPDADIRPNPSPMQYIHDAKPAIAAEEDSLISPYLQQDELKSYQSEQSEKPDDTVVKSVEFHASSMNEVSSETLMVRSEDKAIIEPNTVNTNTPSEAQCFALMGASGGTGVTSLCIQLAYDIAKRTKKSVGFGEHLDPTVCLIDLDFETGSCSSYLDIPPALEISDICGPAHRIDSSIVQALMSQHESGIAVLSTPNALGANSLANPEAVLALLDSASQLYDYVILDLPRIWQSWIGAAISGANHFALVGELTIPSLHTARTRIANIEKVLGDELKCEMILNKVERRSFRNSVRLSDAEKALQRPVSATICVDSDTIREAINCGEAVEVIRPEARYVKDVRELSMKWVSEKKNGKMFKERRKKRAAA